MNEVVAQQQDDSLEVNDNASSNDLSMLLTFLIGKDVYALDIDMVIEITEYTEVTRIPMAPSCIQGMFNLRGHVLPLINLAQRFDKSASEINKRTSIIVLDIPYQGEFVSLGVMVDAISQVVQVAKYSIEPCPEFGVGIDASFVKGMVKEGEGFVSLLDVDKVFSIETMANLIGDFSRQAYAHFCHKAKGRAAKTA